MPNQTKVTGVVLAGGRARRMNNQDKGLIDFNGRPLVSYAIDALQVVADQLIINANRNFGQYQRFGFPVVADQSDNFDGPLAGILTAMIYAGEGDLLIVPCDLPFITANHLKKMLSAHGESNADVAVAFDGERLHPVFLGIKSNLKASLSEYLATGHRKVDSWLLKQKMIKVDFSDEMGLFVNVNSMRELLALEEKFAN